MVFADGDQAAAGGIDKHVGVAQIGRGRQRLRRLARPLAIEALVGVVGEVDDAVMNRIVAAAVLVGTGAGVEVGRGHVLRRAVRLLANDDVAAALQRPAFQPVEVVAVQAWL